jgi:hypothetical protein
MGTCDIITNILKDVQLAGEAVFDVLHHRTVVVREGVGLHASKTPCSAHEDAAALLSNLSFA